MKTLTRMNLMLSIVLYSLFAVGGVRNNKWLEETDNSEIRLTVSCSYAINTQIDFLIRKVQL